MDMQEPLNLCVIGAPWNSTNIFDVGVSSLSLCLAMKPPPGQNKNPGFTGFTNTKAGGLFDPPLTVVGQPAFDTGQMATELLIQMIESKRPVVDFETKT